MSNFDEWIKRMGIKRFQAQYVKSLSLEDVEKLARSIEKRGFGHGPERFSDRRLYAIWKANRDDSKVSEMLKEEIRRRLQDRIEK